MLRKVIIGSAYCSLLCSRDYFHNTAAIVWMYSIIEKLFLQKTKDILFLTHEKKLDDINTYRMTNKFVNNRPMPNIKQYGPHNIQCRVSTRRRKLFFLTQPRMRQHDKERSPPYLLCA